MLFVEDDAFLRLFRECRFEAFHLEVQDTYETPEESEPFRRFVAGEPDDYAWLRGWLDLVQEATTRGVSFTRVRVITEPHVDYTRWSLAVTPVNIQAGEDIRYLSRQFVDVSELTTDDFWLFDGRIVAYTMFTPDGAASGAAVTTDPVTVRRCANVRNTVWRRATPFAEYSGTTPVSPPPSPAS